MHRHTLLHRRVAPLALLLCALAVAACGGSATTQGGASSSPTSTLPPTQASTPALPSAGTVSATISGLGALGADDGYWIAASDTAVWVLNGNTGNILRIDPRTNTLVATLPIEHGAAGIGLTQGAVWVTSPNDGKIFRIDPQTNQVVATIMGVRQENSGQAIAVSPDAVWVTDFAEDTLLRIDPRTNTVAARISHATGITGVSFGAGSVWLCNHHSTSQGLVRLDPQTNQVRAAIDVSAGKGVSCTSVVALDQVVWAVSFSNGQPDSVLLERIDPATNTITATIAVPRVFPDVLAADARGVWLIDGEHLFRADPQTNRLVGQLALSGVSGVAVGAGSMWIGQGNGGKLLRITPAP